MTAPAGIQTHDLWENRDRNRIGNLRMFTRRRRV
uniref:Uncharacterized protein n=1 Tax=Trichinella nativa TaxID=6335 RepID=A0A0V1KHM3_9BILA